ncbi:MAG: FtsX-like permease family protein [Acidobacteriota bacterium]
MTAQGSAFQLPWVNVLMAVVLMVLLVACADIAGLMLARSASRNRELALRRALGASRVRLIRQVPTECFMLSPAGALLGILFARWGSVLPVSFISTTGNQVFLDLSHNWRTLGFTASVAIVTGLLFGVLPHVPDDARLLDGRYERQPID